jgi:hypothetical protein
MQNYKGIFFNKEKEKKFYEGGAHFKYLDLVKVLNNLLKEEKNNNSITNKSINSNLTSKYIYAKSESKNDKNTLIKKKQINSNLLTLNNYKDNIMNKNILKLITENNINRNRLKTIHLNRPLEDNHKISTLINKEYNTIDLYGKNPRAKSLFSNNRNKMTKENNISAKFNINKNLFSNKLPLIESVYLNKLVNKNNIEIGKDFSCDSNNKTKINKFIKNKVFSQIGDINYKNGYFLMKASDNNKNNNNFETISNMNRKRNYNFGRSLLNFGTNNNK